ncbi:nuclear speckle RNA-binding protein B-like [Zingiber officinale]|uniref:nuclear speckle RNA-binding protein B-like n=1 Tax=Zingiber officinale TaxID=94328 RepID=UPI001C4C5765|nr:nuclear speckle RNA-binding protein B-like [Zingiber officinale]
MSPSAREFNALQRHTPLKVHKESHLIQKPSSSSSSSTISTIGTATNNPRQRRQPVIIYTHAPKIIHATVDNFKEIVQRLTGQSQATAVENINNDDDNNNNNNSNEISAAVPPPATLPSPNDACKDNNENILEVSSSGTPSKNYTHFLYSSTAMMPPLGMPNPPFLGDLALFGHGSSDFLHYPTGGNVFDFAAADSVSFWPSVPNVNSDILSSYAIEEAIKTYHDVGL